MLAASGVPRDLDFFGLANHGPTNALGRLGEAFLTAHRTDAEDPDERATSELLGTLPTVHHQASRALDAYKAAKPSDASSAASSEDHATARHHDWGVA